RWLTVRAVLARDEPWARAGHEVAWAQVPLEADGTPYLGPDDLRHHPRRSSPALVRGQGGAEFDPVTGRLTRLFGLDVEGPRLERWRAPSDDDRSSGGEFRGRQPGQRPLAHRGGAVDYGDAAVGGARPAGAATDLGG